VETAALRAAERAGTEVSLADADADTEATAPSGGARLRRRRPLAMVEDEDCVKTDASEQAGHR
jgi:hypothetical protein